MPFGQKNQQKLSGMLIIVNQAHIKFNNSKTNKVSQQN